MNDYLTTFMTGLRRTRRGAAHRNNTKRSYGYAVQPIRDHLGTLALSEVTAEHCEEFIVAQLEAGRSAAAIQLSLGLLRRMLDRATKPSGYVAADEVGQAVAPETFSRHWRQLVKAGALPPIRLHDGRHAANTLLAAGGVPDHIRAAWLGHTIAINNSVCTHTRPADLLAARDALTSVYSRV